MGTRVLSIRISEEQLASLTLHLKRYGCVLNGYSSVVRQALNIFTQLSVDEDILPDRLTNEDIAAALANSHSDGSPIMQAVREIRPPLYEKGEAVTRKSADSKNNSYDDQVAKVRQLFDLAEEGVDRTSILRAEEQNEAGGGATHPPSPVKLIKSKEGQEDDKND